MGRREEPIDPSVPPHRRKLAQHLRDVRKDCGSPPYRKLAKYAHRAVGLLSEAANGKRLPAWDTAEAYVTGCYQYADWLDKIDGAVSDVQTLWNDASKKDKATSGNGGASGSLPKEAAGVASQVQHGSPEGVNANGDVRQQPGSSGPRSSSRKRRKTIKLSSIGLVLAIVAYAASAFAFDWWPFKPDVWHAKVVNTWSAEKEAYLGVFRYRSPDTPKDTDHMSYDEGASLQIICQERHGRVVTDPTSGKSSSVWNKTHDGWWVPDLYLNLPKVTGDSPPLGIPTC